jgi:predicted heme/steroid binding protein
MRSKYLAGIFLFIFWSVATALITAGLLSGQAKQPASVASLATNQSAGGTMALTATEVAKHKQAGDCWMIVNGRVYDLTSLINTHSGGSQEILRDCGRDGSAGFNTKYQGASHSGSAQAILASYYLGEVGATVNVRAATSQINQTPHPRSAEDENEDD